MCGHALSAHPVVSYTMCISEKNAIIAVQCEAIAIHFQSIIDKGYKTVRVTVRGLGPGRMVCIHISFYVNFHYIVPQISTDKKIKTCPNFNSSSRVWKFGVFVFVI